MAIRPAEKDPTVRRLLAFITEYDNAVRTWHDDGKLIIQRYKDERPEGQLKIPRFNILWSNIETLKPFLYSSTPKPIVSTRHDDAPAAARIAAEVLERSLAYTIAEGHFGSALRNARDDYLLPGRGTAWVRYKPTFVPAAAQVSESAVSDDPAQMAAPDGKAEDGTEKVAEVVGWEETITDFVHWRYFGHNIAPTWEEVDVVWRIVPMDRDALVERFGEEIGRKIPLDWRRTDGKTTPETDEVERAAIYECWWKSKRKAFWISKSWPQLLDARDDPLKLDHFFPCPKPVYATITTDTLIPTPDFKQYRDQANEIDDLTARIASLTKSIKAAGVYDSTNEALKNILQDGHDNTLIPVDSWAAFAEKGGLKGAIELLPMQEIVQTLLSLHDAREKQKADLYEVTGMSDIIRGNTNPEETLGAQQIKVNFASKRLAERQEGVARFASNLIAIMGNVIAMHFSIDTLRAMSGMKLLTNEQKGMVQAEIAQQQAQQAQAAMAAQQQPVAPGAPPAPQPQQPQQPEQMGHNGGPPIDDDIMELMSKPTWEEVQQLLQNEPQRRFSIDIEDDSLVAPDDAQQQAQRTAFLQAVGAFLQQAVQAVEQVPEMAPLLGAMLMFAVKGFRVGRDLVDKFQQFVDAMEAKAKQPQPPKPDPEMERVQGQQTLAQAQQQHQQQMERDRFAFEQQMAQQREVAEQQRAEREMQFKAEIAKMQAAANAQTDIIIARINALAKIVAGGEAKGATPDTGAEQHQVEQGA